MVRILDPIKFQKKCWPHITFFDKQKEIIYSVIENVETMVPACHQVGKDFVAGFIAVYWLCSRRPARAVTTSVKYDQLNDVLWGEIRNFIDTSKYPLPLQYNQMLIRQIRGDGSFVPKSELVGQVISQGESLLGRHLPSDIPRTLIIFDEASGIENMVYEGGDTWSHRKLIIGNPYPSGNFFETGVEEGDIFVEATGEIRRKIIQIKATDSPNVKFAVQEILHGYRKPEKMLIQSENQPWGIYSEVEYHNLLSEWERKGFENPPEKTLTPGVIGFYKYLEHRQIWNPVQQCIRLDAEFYKGAEVMLFPVDWLNAAEKAFEEHNRTPYRKGKTIGVDSAQGGDNTSWAVCDDYGLIELVSMKTPDTSIIPDETIRLMHLYNVAPENVLFDAGGGGKVHADNLRRNGYPVRIVGFGESTTDVNRHKKGMKSTEHKKEQEELRYVYKNRRAEMYGLLQNRLNPQMGEQFSLPISTVDPYKALRNQLRKMPLKLDNEGRMFMLPKNKKDIDSNEKSLTELLGCSPDEADALVLAVFGLERQMASTEVGGLM